MRYLTENLAITLPITPADRLLAIQFAHQQPLPGKADRVYRNTLAVLTIHHYLDMLGIDSELGRSHSWQEVARLSDDVADLYIPEARGRLDCRPVRPTDLTCWVPEPAWSDRLGVVVVQLDEAIQQGTILGFVPTVAVDQLPLSYLRPLDQLIDHLAHPIQWNLQDWLQGAVQAPWQTLQDLPRTSLALSHRGVQDWQNDVNRLVEQLYLSQPLPPARSVAGDPEAALVQFIQTAPDEETQFKAAELLWEMNPQHPAIGVQQALDLGLYLAGQSVALLVAVLPKPDRRIAVLLRVYPLERPTLPGGIQLSGLDESGQRFFDVRARQQDDYIQFKFSADRGDRFQVRVSFGDANVTESFII